MADRPRLIFLLNSAQRKLQQWMTSQQAWPTDANGGGSAPTSAQSGVLFALAKADGTLGHTWAHYVPDVSGGEVRGFFVTVSDVTALKSTQLALSLARCC